MCYVLNFTMTGVESIEHELGNKYGSPSERGNDDSDNRKDQTICHLSNNPRLHL